MRAYNNLSYIMMNADRYEEARRYQEEGVALGARLGFGGHVTFLRAHLEWNRFIVGEWEPMETALDEMETMTETTFYGGAEGELKKMGRY